MTNDFSALVQGPSSGNYTCFLEGPVGTGKTQVVIDRLNQLLQRGVSGYSVLVLLPDRSGVMRYDQALAQDPLGALGAVDLHTYYGLATRLVRLFWPLVAKDAGFATPQQPPAFLTYETGQYLMGQLVAPLLEQGYFEGLALRPQRVLSQLLDNLNKAALNGYPISEVGPRLRSAWNGEEARLRYYDQAQQCIELFRGHCLQRGLLDVSLTIEVFHRYLVNKEEFWRYFTERFRHVLVDNLEESVPVAQDLVRRFLPVCDSALLTCDRGAGYRVNLGIDGKGAEELGQLCQQTIRTQELGVASADVTAFAARLGDRLGVETTVEPRGQARKAVKGLIQTRYRAQMLDKVAREILNLVEAGVAPGDISVIAPRADGVLRFMLAETFREADIPFTVVRRNESLREEVVVRACLTLGALAHPYWGVRLPSYDVAEALSLALAPIDPVRAHLAVRQLYKPADGILRPRDGLGATDHERIGFVALERYDALLVWLKAYAEGEEAPFDFFLRRLFGELLSGPDLSPEDAAVYSKLIASATWFRKVAPTMGLEGKAVGQRYVEMIMDGVVAAQYLTDLDVVAAPDSITLVAPIYTYLLSNHVARFQFWLDIGSLSWWEPPHQPLTNPYVLGRRWPSGTLWTDAVDYTLRNENLLRLANGLCQRCREGIYLCASELETSGEIQDSPLLQAVQQVLQEAQ